MNFLALAGRFFLGLIFAGAGASKLQERQAFQHAVRNYKLLPNQIADWVAIWLPRMELGAGIALILGLLARVTAILVSVLLVVFAIGIGINLVRGREIDCGCSGGRYRTIGWPLVVKDVLLAAIATPLVLRGGPTLGFDQLWLGTNAVSEMTALAIFMTITCGFGGYGLIRAARELQASTAQFLGTA